MLENRSSRREPGYSRHKTLRHTASIVEIHTGRPATVMHVQSQHGTESTNETNKTFLDISKREVKAGYLQLRFLYIGLDIEVKEEGNDSDAVSH